MAQVFDVAVIGLGAMGASAASALARRGCRVVGLDPFEPGHDRGSSHGESRAIRLAYFEHPSYVPLARAAYDGWRELERLTGETVLTVTGILEAGHPGSPIVAGSLAASRQHDLPHELLTATDVAARFPQFQLPADWSAVYQPDGGFVRPELAIRLYARLAREAGAEFRIGVRARALRSERDRVVIETDDVPIEAGAVVVAAGGWIGDLVPELTPALTLTRQVLGWFRPDCAPEYRPGTFPVFILDTLTDAIYGFPDFAGTGVKVASHNPCGILQHADQACQDAGSADEARIRSVLSTLVPGAAGTLNQLKTCFYTRTVDEDFVLDCLPSDRRIVVASPCSGHGFKFASILGEVIARLALRDSANFDLSRFSLRRLSARLSSQG